MLTRCNCRCFEVVATCSMTRHTAQASVRIIRDFRTILRNFANIWTNSSFWHEFWKWTLFTSDNTLCFNVIFMFAKYSISTRTSKSIWRWGYWHNDPWNLTIAVPWHWRLSVTKLHKADHGRGWELVFRGAGRRGETWLSLVEICCWRKFFLCQFR